MDNYKKINKQLIEQNSEMRVRLGQERENSSFLCRQLMEERTIRVELQRRLVQMHTKMFADAMQCLCPMENAIDILSDQLAERCRLSEGDSQQQQQSTATLGRRGSNASVRSSMERRRASGASGRSSLERPTSTGSQRRSSLERFTSNIDLPTSPPRRRQSFGRCSIVAAELEADNEDEQESEETTPQPSPRVCSFLEEDEEEYNDQEQSLLEEAEEEHSSTLEEETEADDSEGDEEGSPPKGDTEVEEEAEYSPRDETDRDESHSSRDETERDKRRDKHVADEVQQKHQTRGRPCTRYPKVRVEKQNLLADVTNRCFVTQRNNYSNESLPQERAACSPSTLLRAKPHVGSPKHSENCSIGSPRRLTSDSYNITMQNLLSSTPNSSRMSPASLCGHLEWQQQPSSILATTDSCCETSTLRPRRGCVPKSYMEPSLRAKLRNDTNKKSIQRTKKTKSK